MVTSPLPGKSTHNVVTTDIKPKHTQYRSQPLAVLTTKILNQSTFPRVHQLLGSRSKLSAMGHSKKKVEGGVDGKRML